MEEQKKTPKHFGKLLIGFIVVVIAGAVLYENPTWSPFGGSASDPPKQTAISFAPNDAVKTMGTSVVAMEVPSEPTVNPVDPYDPMPLRIGTVGATAFHRPFCPHAKQSLINHGAVKRINYWTREQIAESRRPGDTYCLASIFDCSDVSPQDFAIAGNDPWCGANIRREYVASGIPPELSEKTLCVLQGYIGVFVDDPNNCIDGSIRGSSPDCDQEACGACTADCGTVCNGCVLVTLGTLNNITLNMGDGNKDGEADVDDYLYYHECYSGPVAATIPCQNVFDYDQDSDVDVTDFDLFVQSYNSGNVRWAMDNYPDAILNPLQAELPLRVGTDGSTYYHRLDCPSVNGSWERHGMEKRVEFYTWDQVDDSGRVPDLNVCLPGTRTNPSGSLQNCTLDDDEDGTLNCDDQCPEDANKIVPGACGCGVVDADPCP